MLRFFDNNVTEETTDCITVISCNVAKLFALVYSVYMHKEIRATLTNIPIMPMHGTSYKETSMCGERSWTVPSPFGCGELRPSLCCTEDGQQEVVDTLSKQFQGSILIKNNY